MQTIRLQTNRKEIAIERDGENVGSIWFDPTDFGLLSRLEEVQRRIEAQNIDIQTGDASAMIEATRQLDQTLRGEIDYVFGEGTSEVVFGNTFTLGTHSGVSMLEQFLDGAARYIEAEMQKENKAAEKRQAKYSGKYKK